MITGIQIDKPVDMHVHLREGEMLSKVFLATASHFSRALIMPNTTIPICSTGDVMRYRNAIMEEANKYEVTKNFYPLMTLKLTKSTHPDMIKQAAEHITAVKLYPEGVTTNSEDGVKDIKDLYPVFEALRASDKVLCIHGEHPGTPTLYREATFLPILGQIAKSFPTLKIVLEHITTADAVSFIRSLPPNVAATITVHHLFITLDDVIGGMLKPHLFCKPIAKTKEDRQALLEAALTASKEPKFFLGTDSAPHAVSKKECASGCAGIFTAPVALSLLAQLFMDLGKMHDFKAFISLNGERFYDLSPSRERLEIVRESFEVPEIYEGVVPFKAGEKLNWAVRMK